jgi:hypothetical protein
MKWSIFGEIPQTTKEKHREFLLKAQDPVKCYPSSEPNETRVLQP